MQSSFWSEFKRREGHEVERVVCEKGDSRVGSAVLLSYPQSAGASFVLCPEGPVLPWHDQQMCRTALRSLVTHVKAKPNVLGLRIEPHLPTPLPSLLRNWSNAPTDLTPADTLILDLTLTDEQILTQSHPKCRYNLKVAERHCVVVTRHTGMELAHAFYGLLLETSNRTGFFVEPFGFFLNLLSTLVERQAGELYVSRHDGEILAAILVVRFGRRATYLYGGSSSKNRHVMPVYPLHLAAIQGSREHGCVEYDFYGIDATERRDHLYAGITRFKKQWGGQVQRRIGARDYVFYDRLADLVVERLGDFP